MVRRIAAVERELLEPQGREDRKRADEALRESEERLQTVVSNAPIILFAVDREGLFTLSEGRGLDTLGLKPGEVVGRSVFDVFPEVPQIPEEFRRALAGEAFNSVLDVAGVTLESWYHPLRDPNGEVIGVIGVSMDITERKRSDEALRESEEKYRRLVQDATEGIAIVAGLEVKFVNRALLKMYGGESEEEVVGRPLTDLVAPEHRELMVERSYAREKGQDVPAQYEFKALRKDGTQFDAELSVSLISYEGRVARQAVIRDITERKRAEEALEESEARYRLLAENTSDLIWTMDLSLRYTYMSPAITRMRGYSVEEIVGTTIQETMTPASLEAARKALAEELALERTGQADPLRSRKIELEMYCKDGSTIWTEMNTTFLRDSDGRPTGILGVTRDISERKRAETALRTMNSAIASSINAIALADLDGNLTYVNPSLVKMWGYDDEEQLLGRPAHKFWQTRERALEVGKALRDKGDWRGELVAIRRDGSTFDVEMSASMVTDEAGKRIYMMGSFLDISERKRAEEEQERLNAELQARAITDSLTGLHNHAHFYQRLAEEIDRSKRYSHCFALVMMDVDAFKHYNDARGHQAGDEALRLVGECIRSAMRRSDLAFRYGGDEFAAILLNADASRARAIVNRINKRIAASLKEMSDRAAEWLGLSAGIACFPEDATIPDELVKMADDALYNAKRLAWARGVMVQGQAVESPFLPLHETQSGTLSAAASSLAAALQDLGASEVVAEPDLRTIAAVGAAAEVKDPYIRGHQERISRWGATLAEHMGLSRERVRNIRIAGLLHDLGKVGIHDSVLNKPGKLTEEEFAKIKEHPALGAMMIVAKAEALQGLGPMVRHHHERFDGSGYPDGLARGQIPLEARILSVVDVFDAMTHERAYRKALPREEAIAELKRGAGTQFDPRVVKTFLELERRRSQESVVPVEATSGDRRLMAVRVSGGHNNRAQSGSKGRVPNGGLRSTIGPSGDASD